MSGTAPRSSPSALFASFALITVGAAVAFALHWSLSPLIGLLAGMNLASIALYGYDKHAAVKNRLRVPEIVLHLVALLGGSPAALLGQKLFRHKTVKTSFRISFWLIVVVQIAVIAAALWWRRHPPSWLPDALRSSVR
jgi:uncharacterized membrane protein YsdA (DUF1294 family)